jgi:hypothetical protein
MIQSTLQSTPGSRVDTICPSIVLAMITLTGQAVRITETGEIALTRTSFGSSSGSSWRS